MLRNKLFSIFILFFCAFSRVYASQLEVIPITNYFVHINEQKSELKMFKDGSSGNILFAMSPYETVESYSLKFVYIDDYKGINEEVKNSIQDMMFLGYGYKGRNDIKWYIITQYMLWEYLDYDFDIKNELGLSVKNEYYKDFNEFLTLINNFEKTPSYFSGTIDINYNEKFLLNDSNNVENNFNLVPYAFLRIGKNGEEKLLYGTKPVQSKLVAVRKEQNSSYNKIFYSDELYFMNNVNVSRRLFEVNVNIHGGKIKIINTDEFNQPIKGTVYNIYNSNDKLITTLTTNEVGEAVTEYIPYDNYYLKEINIDSKYVFRKEKVEINMIDYTVTELTLKNGVSLDESADKIPNNEEIVSGGELPSNNSDFEVLEDKSGQENIEPTIETFNDDIKDNLQEGITKEESVLVNVPNTKMNLTKYILIIGCSLLALGIKMYVK